LAILIVWTLALPVYSLWEWQTQPPPSAANFRAFQYSHKVLSDVWTAVAVVLGLLLGIKKAAIARRGPVGTAQSIRMSFQSWSALMTRPDTH
jgi:hypothetical protein